MVVDYDRSTALVVVDVQNDFADPKGSLYLGEGEHAPQDRLQREPVDIRPSLKPAPAPLTGHDDRPHSPVDHEALPNCLWCPAECDPPSSG